MSERAVAAGALQGARVSSNRLRSLDLARGVAVVVMVIIHGIAFTGSDEVKSSAAAYFFNTVISILAAPVFMFIMGVLLGLSTRYSIKKNVYRGLAILGLGYALNIVRETLPVGLALWSGYLSPDELEQPVWFSLLEFDILQFAGLALIGLALLRRAFPWPFAWVLIGGAVIAGMPHLEAATASQPALKYALAIIAGGADYSYFPILPWIAFPLFGMFYGAAMKKSTDRNRFFLTGAITGGALFLIGMIVIFTNDSETWSDWYTGQFRQGRLPLSILLTFIGFQGLFLPLCHWMSEKIPDNALFRRLNFWSANVTVYYCTQWVLIGWLCVFTSDLTWPAVAMLIIGVLFITDRIVSIIFKRKKSDLSNT